MGKNLNVSINAVMKLTRETYFTRLTQISKNASTEKNLKKYVKVIKLVKECRINSSNRRLKIMVNIVTI